MPHFLFPLYMHKCVCVCVCACLHGGVCGLGLHVSGEDLRREVHAWPVFTPARGYLHFLAFYYSAGCCLARIIAEGTFISGGTRAVFFLRPCQCCCVKAVGALVEKMTQVKYRASNAIMCTYLLLFSVIN